MRRWPRYVCALAVSVLLTCSARCVLAAPPGGVVDAPAAKSAAEEGFPAGFIREAPLPEGFPPPSPPGEVVEKTYPLARSYSAAGPNAFFKCFMYLQQKKHEMTAPVVMDYAAEGTPRPGAGVPVPVKRMHFLLEKVALDEPQEKGPIKVADMPQMRVLSIAYQGELTPKKTAELEGELAKALEDRPELRAAGERRILGYNSPMVPRDKVFWEVQLPVEQAAK